MQITEWSKYPDLTGRDLYLRSTISVRGGIIGPKGMKPGLPEFTPRRYSVIDSTVGGIKLVIGAVAYKTDYDSEDPYQAHEKYLAGEFDELMVVYFNGTLEEALTWIGSPQTINQVG